MLAFSTEGVHSNATADVNLRKEKATVGLYSPNLRGYTRHTMVQTMGSEPERVR